MSMFSEEFLGESITLSAMRHSYALRKGYGGVPKGI